MCRNEHGRHYCECFAGYALDTDGKTCIGKEFLISKIIEIVNHKDRLASHEQTLPYENKRKKMQYSWYCVVYPMFEP